jgi:hypothetical protein
MTDESLKLLTLALSVIGTVSGIAGTCLGIFNSWRQVDREKVKLTLQWTIEPWGGRLGPAVVVHSLRIENRSLFVVTIAEAGVVFERNNGPKVTFSQTLIEENGDALTRSLPLRLDSHDSMTLTSDTDTHDSVFRECIVHYAYVRTGDGTVAKVSSSLSRYSSD